MSKYGRDPRIGVLDWVGGRGMLEWVDGECRISKPLISLYFMIKLLLQGPND